jgi:uncharacterized Zn-finger protein
MTLDPKFYLEVRTVRQQHITCAYCDAEETIDLD